LPPTSRVSREPSVTVVTVKAATCNDASVIVNKLNDYPMVTDDG